MIRALGKLKFVPAITLIEDAMQSPGSGGAIVVAAAIAYIRLKRIDDNDAKPILDLIGNNPNRSIIDGSLSVLAFDDMKPPIEQLCAILPTPIA
jgi:hypothetical protein